MNYIIRKIKAALWENYVVITSSNLHELDKELELDESCLSVYLIPSLKDIDLVIIGLASNRKSVQRLEYSVIKLEDFELEKIELKKILGDTPYEKVNKFHRDIVINSNDDLLKVANLIKNGKKQVMLKPDVKVLLTNVKDELIEEKLEPTLKKELGIK